MREELPCLESELPPHLMPKHLGPEEVASGSLRLNGSVSLTPAQCPLQPSPNPQTGSPRQTDAAEAAHSQVLVPSHITIAAPPRRPIPPAGPTPNTSTPLSPASDAEQLSQEALALAKAHDPMQSLSYRAHLELQKVCYLTRQASLLLYQTRMDSDVLLLVHGESERQNWDF